MSLTIILTQDGSHTILSERFGVSYHSKYGSLQETETVFLEAGLQYVVDQGASSVKIFEMGFGTGLNAIMTYLYTQSINIDIDYHTVEAYPISHEQVQNLNYTKVLEMNAEEKSVFLKMHELDSGETHKFSNSFTFTKYIQKLEDFDQESQFDLIYYDAFAPTSQEELWTEEMTRKLAKISAPESVLVTYCAKGSFKRALRAAGYVVDGIPGPIGKREMTRATLVSST